MLKSVEVKVGFFVVVGFAVLTIFIFSIGNLHHFHKGYYIKAVFNYGDGIDTGVPVRLAGVQVGEVKAVKISAYEGIDKVETTLWINSDIGVQKDAEVFINSLGFLGEKYVEIFPGSKDAPLLKEHDTIVGIDSIPMRKLTEKGMKAMNSLEKSVETLNDILGDPSVRPKLKSAIMNLDGITTDLKTLLSRANSLMEKIEKGEGTVGKFLTDDRLYNHMDEFILDLKAHPWKLLHKPRGEK